LSLGSALNTDLLPTKNLPSGSLPTTTAGAPSYLTVVFTALVVLLSNTSDRAFK